MSELDLFMERRVELCATLRRDGWGSMEARTEADKRSKTERESEPPAIRRALPDTT